MWSAEVVTRGDGHNSKHSDDTKFDRKTSWSSDEEVRAMPSEAQLVGSQSV
jgi:hypothetical protein